MHQLETVIRYAKAISSIAAALSICVGCELSTPRETPTRSTSVLATSQASSTAGPTLSAEQTPAAASGDAPVASASAPLVASAVPRDVRLPTKWRADAAWGGSTRVNHAKETKGPVVEELFAKAGVAFPAAELLFRIFKLEEEFEVWAGDGKSAMALIGTWGICAASGELGPKRNEGDHQVPEGFYKVGFYHPTSSYYLAAQVDYPNASDKIRGGPKPGSEIMIHGNCVSVGCVAMTDERIEEIYWIGWSTAQKGKPTNIQIFPSRDIPALLANADYAVHHEFWKELLAGYQAFEQTRRVPLVKVDKDGRYVVTPVHP